MSLESSFMASDREFLRQVARVYQGGDKDFPWFCYAALVYQINDDMDHIGDVWEVAVESVPDEVEQLNVTRGLREALLKASVLVGFPKGINALTALRTRVLDRSPKIQHQLDQDKSLRQSLTRSEKDRRGLQFFKGVYAQHTDRVLQNMSIASGGDLVEFAINAVYGDLMASTEIFSAKYTGLLEFLACYATAGTTVLQAKSHMYGAHNLGNTKVEIRAATTICELVEQRLGHSKDRSTDAWKWLAKADGW